MCVPQFVVQDAPRVERCTLLQLRELLPEQLRELTHHLCGGAEEGRLSPSLPETKCKCRPPNARQRMRMDQLRSVGLAAVQTLAPILDELAAASDVAQQGAVAHVGLVVEVGLPILIAPGHLRPIFWVRGGDSAAEDGARRWSVRCSVG